jgi:hypothetical protein
MKQRSAIGLAILVFACLLVWAGYGLERHEHFPLMLAYAGMLGAGFFLARRLQRFKEILVLGLFFRLLLFAAEPQLSDDYFRFIWDGKLWHSGEHPFARLPVDYMQEPELWQEALFSKLNSPEYFTIYPSVHQFVFVLATLPPVEDMKVSVFIMRLILLLGEWGTLWLLGVLLRLRFKPDCWLGFYAFNPLVILELTGNLHFEGLMIFFVLLALVLLHYSQDVLSAVALALAVGVKLLPLLLLPVLLRHLGWRKGAVYSGTVVGVSLVLMLPLLSADFLNSIESIALYFNRFEFNPSLYALARAIGIWLTGYNQIALIGPAMALMATLLLSIGPYYYPKRLKLEGQMAMSWMIYLFCSTTVHAWYVIPALAFGLVAGLRAPLLWSALVFITYLQYLPAEYREMPLIWILEYLLVFVFFAIDLRNKGNQFPFKR